jgi:dihydrodipicolinate synthase/N-acetylneuraminate lyase
MSNPAGGGRARLTGVIAAMLTPMAEGGARIDLEAAGRLAGWLVDKGVHGLYIAGTTGEGLYLTPEEHRGLVHAVVKAAKDVPVVAHVGALTTAQAGELARQAVRADATAVAAIPPPYYGLNREELLGYFSAIASAAESLPLYLYNIPSHARNELSPAFVAECGRLVPSVRGIKDSSGAPGRIPDLVKTLGPGFDVVCGNDDKILHAFQVGAAGIVASGAGVFPELYLGLHAAWKGGRLANAQAAQARIVAMQQALGNGARLGWYKDVLALRGIPVGGVRPPLADASPGEHEGIRQRLRDLALL